MIDKYFIKSFISTCIFVGALLGIIIGLCFYSVWLAWFFLAMVVLFFVWFYRLDYKLFQGRPIDASKKPLCVEKVGFERQ